MKKILAILALLAVSAFADYTVFKTSTGDTISGGQEVYFGTLKDYQKDRTELMGAVAAGTIDGLSQGAGALAKGFLGEGMKYAGAGAGISLVVNMAFSQLTFTDDQVYILLRKNGSDTIAVMFVGDKHPSLSDEEIHNILRNQ